MSATKTNPEKVVVVSGDMTLNGSVANKFLAPTGDSHLYFVLTTSCAVRKFLQHYQYS